MQGAHGGFELELAEDVVVASLGQIALGRIELLLGIQHVHVGSHPHLLAQPGGIERTLARHQRLFQCLDLSHAAGHAKKSLAGLQGGLPVAQIQILPGFFLVGQCFAHLGIDTAALVNRQGQLQADGLTGNGAGDQIAGIAVLTVARHQVKGGIVPGTVPFHFLRGDCQCGALDCDLRALLFGPCDPFCHIVGLGQDQGKLVIQRIEMRWNLAEDQLQSAVPDFEIILRGDFLSRGEVVPRLSLVSVGNGDGAHLEVALGHFQLLADGGLLGVGQGNIVLGEQDVEIGLSDSDDQVLPGDGKLRFSLNNLAFGLLVLGEILFAIDRLGQGQVITVGVVLQVGGGQIHVVMGGIGAQIDARQQQGEALRRFFLAGFVSGARRSIRRILLLRLAIYLRQVGGIGRAGEQHKKREGQGFHFKTRSAGVASRS